MAEERSKTGVLIAVITWLLIGTALAVAAKKWLIPAFKEKNRQQITGQTGSEGKYRTGIRIAADAFSGYSILRSKEMSERLQAQSIKMTIVDDKADYADRIRKLQSGDVQMAVFTIDSFVKAGAELGDFPGSIVYIIDETRGADAMLAYTNAIASLADLNHKDARIVCTADSPSEFLARIVVASFSLPRMPQKWWVNADGAAEVFKQFKAASPSEKHAYVLWEPYVSKAKELPGAQVLLDSSKLRGFIVDVLVCRREFIVSDYATAKSVIEAYARAAYIYNGNPDKLTELIIEDAKATGGERMDKGTADQLAKGIQWKNTVENYAHFGLNRNNQTAGLEHLEDILTKISGVLIKTGVVREDPFKGQPNTVFCDRFLKDMKTAGFHPGREINILTDPAGPDSTEQVRAERELTALTDQQWAALVPVGELRVEPISFGRGTATVNAGGERELTQLAKTLQSWPQYYLTVVGQARPEGDVEANRQLAQERADAAVRILSANRIGANRIRTKAVVASEGTGDAQSVLFVVCQQPY